MTSRFGYIPARQVVVCIRMLKVNQRGLIIQYLYMRSGQKPGHVRSARVSDVKQPATQQPDARTTHIRHLWTRLFFCRHPARSATHRYHILHTHYTPAERMPPANSSTSWPNIRHLTPASNIQGEYIPASFTLRAYVLTTNFVFNYFHVWNLKVMF